MEISSRTISTADGRALRILEAGVLNGSPVLVHHGNPGSRLVYAPWVQDAEERGIRLIRYDRPGYGGSTSQSGRTVASAAEDVAAIARALNLSRLSVWGFSGGGPHALACAELLPNLVASVAVLASLAPSQADGLDWFADMGEDNITEFSTARKGRQALEPFLEAATPEILNATPVTLVQAIRSLLGPADAAALTEDRASYLLDSVREGIQQKRDGWIDDGLALVNPWGFEPSQIGIPVLVMHGAQDKTVPISHGKWLMNQIPNVQAQLFPEEGHFSLSAHRIPDVHAWLLSKM